MPGELCGEFAKSEILGTIELNCAAGIYGKLSEKPEGEAIEWAHRSEVHLGEAYIYANVQGDAAQKYTVEISRIYHEQTDNRDFLLSITDSRLLDTTGGIVQGMSGSPIIQDGKLVGTVTHVLVNDPTRGYGIFIENMLNASE